MSSRRIWFGLACATAAAACATACFVREPDASETAPQQVTEGRESVLSAAVTLEGGCTAVKVGPKHLLVAARCVTNRPAYAIGKTLRFRGANATLDTTPSAGGGSGEGGTDAMPSATDAAPPSNSDAAANADASANGNDSGALASGAGDAGGDAGAVAADPNAYELTIAQVQIHPSFLAKCGTGACLPNKPGAADVADIAVLILSRDIAELPVAPIDLDPVSIGDQVLALGYGCDANAATSKQLRARATKAISSEAVLHPGSPYESRSDLARALGLSYVVTSGPGNAAAGERAPGLCSERDLGAPLFRVDGSSVVGVSTGATVASNARLPLTNEHARVDTLARHGVGAWLSQLGVKTTKTCSAPDAGGCPKQPEPPPLESDAAADAQAPVLEPPAEPSAPGESAGEPPSEQSSADRSEAPEEELVPTKKKGSNDSGGCTAAPLGSTSPASGLAVFAAAAIALVLRSRRRR